MPDEEELLKELTTKDTAAACAFANKIAQESREDNRWYPYLDCIAPLLHHKNSLVRNRAIMILAANARWDLENRYELLLEELLTHIADEKPITARQCIQALPEIASAKPKLAPRIRLALQQADLSGYRDSMRPLLLKDIADALGRMA